MNSSLKNLIAIQNTLSAYKSRPRIIAVSKFSSEQQIRPLLEAGHKDFAESRIQEAMAKWPKLRDEFDDINLHFIGPIQSRKINNIVKLFDFIHSVDRIEIAKKIVKSATLLSKKMTCLLQINIGKEAQKRGIFSEEIASFIKDCHNECLLDFSGLMCIPPAGKNPDQYFSQLSNLAQQYHLKELSMGMSADYHIAARYGATMIRVGSAIFGSKN